MNYFDHRPVADCPPSNIILKPMAKEKNQLSAIYDVSAKSAALSTRRVMGGRVEGERGSSPAIYCRLTDAILVGHEPTSAGLY
jgi:hypothetical protein